MNTRYLSISLHHLQFASSLFNSFLSLPWFSLFPGILFTLVCFSMGSPSCFLFFYSFLVVFRSNRFINLLSCNLTEFISFNSLLMKTLVFYMLYAICYIQVCIQLLQCCTQYVSKFGKLSSGQRTGKGFYSSFYSNPKERRCQRMLKPLHNCTHLTLQ